MEATRYTISADPVDYGEDCQNARACAEAIKAGLEKYIQEHGVDAEVVIVPETQSCGNWSTGDPEIITELADVVVKNWVDWVPSGAANCEEA